VASLGLSRIEIVREVWRAFDAGDAERLMQYMDPEVRCLPTTRPGLSVYEGHSGLRQMFEDFENFIGSFRIEIRENEAVGDQVVSKGQTVRQNQAGNDVQTIPFELVFTFRNGRIVAMESVPNEDI
jgi:ketosteroid isomerase-like protein